jgi:hypothetical protein
MSSLPAWTYSQLETYTNCPRVYYHKHIVKDIPFVPGPEAIWGDKVHAALEHRVKSNTPLPEGMTQLEPLAKKICSMPGTIHVEKKMALDENFQPVDYYSKQAWTRGKGDVIVVSKSTGAVLDYKTGKRKLTDQLALYALYTFAHYPALETVQSGFIWTKDKKIDKETFHREQVPELWNKFLPTLNKIRSSHERNSWQPRTSGLCKAHCSVMTCEHNGKR